MLIEEIEDQLQQEKEIEAVLEKYDWKKFETIVSEIFKENDFTTKQNFRFKTGRNYEIDIIAIKTNEIFCVDCKWWRKGRYKKSNLKDAITLQEARVKEFQKFLKKNPIARTLLKINQNCRTNALIVTLHEEDMIKESNTLIVPVWKLNKFVIDSGNY